jgi:hypothetical protein
MEVRILNIGTKVFVRVMLLSLIAAVLGVSQATDLSVQSQILLLPIP